MNAIVYVDGLNLYHGALKKTSYQWLNIKLLVSNLCKGLDIQKIKYYSTKLNIRPQDDGKDEATIEQQMYWRALQTIPELTVVEGFFTIQKIKAKLTNSDGFAKVFKTEEKMTDVNLATHMIQDGYLGNYDVAVLISNDSDFIETVRVITQDLKLKLILISPFAHNNRRLSEHASELRQIRRGLLEVSQFPDNLVDMIGEFHKPDSFYEKQD